MWSGSVRGPSGSGWPKPLPTENEEGATVSTKDASNEALLTSKEKEVFALGLKRRTNAGIAWELYISLYTVENHVSNILRKLGLKSRREIS